jgi:uncharacterized protein (TIGR02284 family)
MDPTLPGARSFDLASDHASIALLNRLIGICKDGELGFRNAAEDVRSPACKNLFLAYARQRAQFASELQSLVTHLGGRPAREGSLAGLLHRGLMDLRAAVGERSLASVVSECERGEDTAVRAYEEVARELTRGPAAAVIQRQYAAVMTAHDNVRSLREVRQSG